MAIPASHRIVEGTQYARVGEGYIYTLDIANQSTTTPTNIAVTVTTGNNGDGTDVTGDWIATNTPTASGTVITLPEYIVPSGANGDYAIEVKYDSGGYNDARRYIPLSVF